MQSTWGITISFAEPVEGSIPDISIIRVQIEFQLNPNRQAINLPSRSWGDWGWVNSEVVIMGFGAASDGVQSRYLQYGYFRINNCANILDHEFCALSSRNELTTAQTGDGGNVVNYV